jgi:hypothetical protein
MSTSSCHSNSPSSFSNFFPKEVVGLISSIKLEGKVQPTLISLSQFLPININLSKLYDYSQHLVKFMTMLVKEKIFLISVRDPTMSRI